MKSELFLGIDQGTSSTKGVFLNGAGESVFECKYDAPACKESGREVEQDAEGLLLTVLEVINEAEKFAKNSDHKISAAGIAHQRSGVLAWNVRTGEAMHPMITWADTRTYPVIQNLGLGVDRISQKTGIPTIAHFAAGKIALLQAQFRDPTVHVGTLDSFILSRLSKEKIFATEDTMAARTMLYDLEKRDWDDELCRAFKVEQGRLPRIHPSLSLHVTHNDIPFVAMLGDQQAALIGRQSNHNRPLLNLGTIASLSVGTKNQIVKKPGIITSVLLSRLQLGGYQREYRYLSEVTSPITGTVLLEPSKRGWCGDIESLNRLCEESFAVDPQGRAIAYLVNKQPRFPQFPDGIPDVFVCRENASEADRARAVVENVGNLILRMFEEFTEKGFFGDAARDSGAAIEIDVAGGGGQLSYLLQYLSDCSGHTLHFKESSNAGARGAALAAWMSVKNQSDAGALNGGEGDGVKTYRPQQRERSRRYLMWQKLERDVLNGGLPGHAEVS